MFMSNKLKTIRNFWQTRRKIMTTKRIHIVGMLLMFLLSSVAVVADEADITVPKESDRIAPRGPEPIIHKSSMIKSASATEDSPDIAVTTASNTTQSENSVFVDPSNPLVLLNANNSSDWPVTSILGAAGWVSTDGGQTWSGSIDGVVPESYCDPATAIDLNGRMYVGYITDDPYGQQVAWSDDLGITWNTSWLGTGYLLDKNHLWIDNSATSPHEGNLYSSWTNMISGSPAHYEVEICRCTDRGPTWSTPVVISDEIDVYLHQGVNIQTGPNGEVYAVWAIYLGSTLSNDETSIGFAKSTDGGVTWSPATEIIENIKGIRATRLSGGKTMRVNSFPSMTVNRQTGAIYVVWTNIGVPGINTGDPDIYMIKSTDGGSTWGTPLRINQDDPGNGKDQWFPWLACDPVTGNIGCIFYDSRNFPGNDMAETFVAVSTDEGATWEDFRVSDAAWSGDAISGFSRNYAGDYIGIDILDNHVYPMWCDDRTGNMLTYVSPFEIETQPQVINVPGDQPNIQAGINVASDGDIVMVAPDTYTGSGNTNVSFLGKSITVQSSGGPEVTIIDCGGVGSENRGFIFDNRETSAARLTGFTIQNGDVRDRYVNYVWDRHGGAIRIKSASPTISNCVFQDNQGFLGGAIHCMKIVGEPDDVYPTITDCVFRRNSANDGSSGTNNDGGAILFINSHPTVTGCLFDENRAMEAYGGALYMHTCTGTIDGCTFSENGSIHGGAMCLVFTDINLSNTIVANSTAGCGIKVFNGSTIASDCNDFWNNSGGSICVEMDSTQLDPNTIFLDPLFCDWEDDDYTLAENSPCAAALSPCGELIGSEDVGCGPFRPIIWVEGTWGDDIAGDGSAENPYRTIAKGISMAIDNDTVFAGPGRYVENIDFGGKLITVHGYLGPEVTILEPATLGQYTIRMTNGEPLGTQFSGFTVTRGGDTYTVMIDNGGEPLITGCVFDYNIRNVSGNNKTVIRTDWSNPTISDNLFIHNGGISCVGIYYGTGTIINNTFDDNNRGFLSITTQGIAKNNIVTNSSEYGIYGTWTEIDYNDVWNNNPNYQGGSAGPHDISADPVYIDVAKDRYLVEYTSPCVGAGESGVDIGAFQVRYVPGQYTAIQGAVDAADDGDYVLVYSGTYAENIEIIEKGVKIVSHIGIDNLAQTVLQPFNGSSEIIDIRGDNHETVQITGFTFQWQNDAHTITIMDEAYALISHNDFTFNLWGDYEENNVVIYSHDSRPYITRNLFHDNFGLACVGIYSGFGQVINNTFDTNVRGFFTISGQGIARNNIVTYSSYYGVYGNWTDLDYNNVWENWPDYDGGAQAGPNDISTDPMYTAEHRIDDNSPCVDVGHPDAFYKDPDRSRNDMGWWATERPWDVVHVPYDVTSIQEAIEMVAEAGEVIVDPGNYRENIDFLGKTIRVVGAGNTPDGDTTFLRPLVADNPTVLIVTGEGAGTELSGFTICDGGDTYTVTIGGGASPLIANNIFYDNIICGGPADDEEDVILKEIIPEGPDSDGSLPDPGGGSPPCGYNKVIIKCQAPSGTPVIKRNLFYDNGGISCVGIWTDAYAEIINNTFDNNPRGFLNISTNGGVAINNIVTNSAEYGIHGSTWTQLEYNNVWNNNPNYTGGAVPGTGSISLDPLYSNAALGLYYLQTASPCIDAGHPDPQYNDPDGSRNDMGAFWYDAGLLLPKQTLGLPSDYSLAQNYPNPFNPTTMIRFALPKSSNVKLAVFNILGQQIVTLVNESRQAGIHEVVWDGRDRQGQTVASGIYFYHLTTDDFVDSKKMVLLK
jgi:hypothetical protein